MQYSNEFVAGKLYRWRSYLQHFSLPVWEEIPDFGLYMEQVITLLQQYLNYLPPELREEQPITAAAINNYVRTRVIPVPVKKRYYRIHIAYLIMILTLKHCLSIALIQRLLPVDLSESELEQLYRSYVKRHRAVAQYFTEQVAAAAAPILHGTRPSEYAAERTEDLIVMAAILGGFSRLLSEKLLLLEEDDLPVRAESVAEEKR